MAMFVLYMTPIQQKLNISKVLTLAVANSVLQPIVFLRSDKEARRDRQVYASVGLGVLCNTGPEFEKAIRLSDM